jgi:hypothetical protein
MRLSELITTLDRDNLEELATRVVPAADEIDRDILPHKLEIVLAQTGHVEQVIVARRPVASLLLRLLAADDYLVGIEAP